MGWLKKKFRQLDKRIRKIFGKNAWLKVAALIGGVYMGMGGNSFGTLGKSGNLFGQGGKLRAFGGNFFGGIKNMFWKSGTAQTSGVGSVGVPGKAGHIPGTPATVATKGSLTWAGQAAAQTGLSVAAGYGQAKLMEGDPVGQYVAAGSNEPSTIDVVQNAYNAYAGQPVNILEAYDNLDYGTASTQVAENFLLRGRRIGVS